jgi:hypothetical protein
MGWYFLLALFIAMLVGCLMLLKAGINIDFTRRQAPLEHKIELSDLFVNLEFVIKIECDLYETYLENNTDQDLTTITNTEFTNIYQDLSMRCLKAVSPQFWEMVEVYMTRESAQTYITQRVYDYLAKKVQG